MKLLKNEKGTYRYINKQRVNEIIRTIFMFACALGLYFIGFITLKTNKSIWTILAVLSILPAAKSAVSMIMFLRFSSLSKEEYEIIEKCKGAIPVIYELVFTTSEKAFYVKSAACSNATIIMLLDDPKNKNLSKELKNHINAAIQRENMHGYSLKIYTDINEYTKRLFEMDNNLEGQLDTSSARVFALFEAITI